MNTNTTCDTHDLLNCDCDIENSAAGTEQAQDSVVRPCQLGVAAKHKVNNCDCNIYNKASGLSRLRIV